MLLPLTPADLSRVRFVVSPWWETVAAVGAIIRETPLHRSWARRTLRAMREDAAAPAHWDQLRAFILRSGLIADTLTPAAETDETIAVARARVAEQDLALWTDDLVMLRERAERPASIAVLDAFEADPAAGVRRILDALEWFWTAAVQPAWGRIHALQIADIEHRTRLISHGGLDEMLRTLHPQVTRTDEGLDIAGKCCELGNGLRGQGLILVPCVFAWPGTLVLNRPPFMPTLTYAPRGVGALWERRDDSEESALSQLMGATRANVLRQLDVPMTTTHLAAQLTVATATASEHLRVLTGAGLLRSFRRGREVYYQRTALGDGVAAPEVLSLSAH